MSQLIEPATDGLESVVHGVGITLERINLETTSAERDGVFSNGVCQIIY